MISNIFNHEIKDGLLDALMCDGTVAYCSEAMGLFNDSGDLTESSEFSLWDSLRKINQQSIASLIDSSFDQFKDRRSSAASNPKQLDLFYLTSILVSTGWNKNDDVFTPLDTWAARKTPEDKQFNFMHNEKDIIGHITGNYIIDPSGNIISDDDLQEPPEDFNIATNSVIYTSWADIELKQRIDRIIAEIKQGGKWFVSMECLFPAFDYALQDSKGQTRLIKREESSAFLTKHLRSYGGTGEYRGYKIGRVLRDLSFSGKGLVSKPANPKSIILTSSNESDIEENNMTVQADQLNKELAELAEAKVMNEKMKKEQEEVKAQLASVQATVAEKEEAIANYQKQVEELSSTLAQVQATMQELTLAKKQMEEEMVDMKKKQKMEKRKATLVEAGVEDSDLEATLASFDPLADDAFELVVAVMKKKAQKAKEEDKTKEYASDSTSEQVANETLEDAQEQESSALASLNENSDQEEEHAKDFRSAASAWFESNVLKTKPNSK